MNNIPSTQLKPGDVVSVRGKSRNIEVIVQNVATASAEVKKYSWLEFSSDSMEGKFIEYPEREIIPEKINEQLIVELYSK